MLEGAIRIDELAQQTKSLGMPAVALTDLNNMFGALQFASACKRHDIKPILGCELNIIPDRNSPPSKRVDEHLVLLAENQTGYANLVRLVSLAWVEGLTHGVPTIDLAYLREYSEGLIGLSGAWLGTLQTV